MIVESVEPPPGGRPLALTFDDGPSEWTPGVLDALAEHGARATFFVLGSRVHGREAVLRRALAEGHELANHTLTHPRCSLLSAAEVGRELGACGELLAAATGSVPWLVRPPYGDGAAVVERAAAASGLGQCILWSVDPADWAEPPAETIERRVLERAAPGGIVLLHDGFPDRDLPAPRTRQGTVEALRRLLPRLRADGYGLVTVSELLAAGSG